MVAVLYGAAFFIGRATWMKRKDPAPTPALVD